MTNYHSRLARTEERKNIRKAFFYIILTISVLVVFVTLGLPSIAKFAAFLTGIRQSNEPITKDDTSPPIKPKLDPVTEATSKTKIEITGSTEPGATVVIFFNRKENEVLANKEGRFFYTLQLNKGTNTLAVLAKDNSGNESEKTETIKIEYDDQPPELELTNPEDKAEFYGSKQRQVVIEGNTEEGASLNINNRLVVVEKDGSFAFATTLSEGENKFNIKAMDKAGNFTEKSLTLHFSL